MKSPINYYGGKSNLAEKIIQYSPINPRLYLEAFFGSGAVFFYKSTSWADVEIINDLNGDVVNFFRVLRDKPKKLIDRLQLTPYARREIQDSTTIIENSKDEITRALYFFVRANQSFSANMRANGGWGLPKDGKDKAQTWINKTSPEFLYRIAERLRKTHIENKPALEVMDLYNDPKAFYYLDPPYLAVASEKDKTSTYQGYDMREADHKFFIDKCLSLNSMMIISGYDHPLYDPLMKNGWRKIEIHVTASSGNVGGRKNNVDMSRIEILWISPNIDYYVQGALF